MRPCSRVFSWAEIINLLVPNGTLSEIRKSRNILRDLSILSCTEVPDRLFTIMSND